MKSLKPHSPICFLYPITFTIIILFNSCTDGNKFNAFTIKQDEQLGAQVCKYIESPESGIVVLDTAKYHESYSHLYRIRDYILNSEKLKHKNEFSWRARIIQNDKIQNAFATPGGYIYVFTGLIKYLDNEDQLAGVLAHEMAHADQRHSTAMLTKTYGISFLLSVILGTDNSMVKDLTQNMLSLSFSRKAEEDADKLSVSYLCRTKGMYKADGAASFFEKLGKQEKQGVLIEFLSTHPSPPNRILILRQLAKESNCDINAPETSSYNSFKNSLP